MGKMTPRRWLALTLSLVVLALSGIAGAVILIDPFQIYREATRFIAPISSGTQSYSNAGVARRYAYDSLVIGSSMTENFVPSALDALFGGSFVKLCINGGSSFNHRQMMDIAFDTHAVRRVLYGLDVDALTYFYTQPKTEMPEYLYDDFWPNDVHYWYNVSVLSHYLPQCLSTWGRSDPGQRDAMYAWGDLYPYGRDYALLRTVFDTKVFPQKEPPAPFVMSQQTMLNVEHNIVPFLEAHPETEFLFFFPPYSLARWYAFYRTGDLAMHLSQAEAVCARLMDFPNVRVYDYRARTDWILDLSNYIDDYHYGPWINEAIAQDMAKTPGVQGPEAVRQNSLRIAALVDQIVAAGRWPDRFALSEPTD